MQVLYQNKLYNSLQKTVALLTQNIMGVYQYLNLL